MRIEKKHNKVVITKQIMRGETFRIKESRGIMSITFLKKKQLVLGYSSACEDDKHILLLDYDNTCLYVIEQELKMLIKTYHLTPFYIFYTKQQKINNEIVGNYHAVCLSKSSGGKIAFILKRTSCDQNFKTMPTRSIYRSWVLRIGPKKGSNNPKYLKTIPSKYYQKVSSAHLKMLQQIYPKLRNEKYLNQDHQKQVKIQVYETRQ